MMIVAIASAFGAVMAVTGGLVYLCVLRRRKTTIVRSDKEGNGGELGTELGDASSSAVEMKTATQVISI